MPEEIRGFRQRGRLLRQRAEDVLADFLGERAIVRAAESSVENQADVAFREGAEGGFIAVEREGIQK